MTREHWKRVKEIFTAALQYGLNERVVFLSSACGNDDALRKEVESLLASHDKEGSFIDSPAYEIAAEMLTDDPELAVGQTVGHYEILSTLGKGGMGKVYLARDTRLGRKVALKFLPGGLIGDDERLRRFEQEARAASALNHPNILTVHEVGEVDGRRFMVTEFIDGETLRRRIETGPLTVGETLRIVEQMASALAAAHSEGIVHRDIKPENIMLRPDGIVKVLDFGLAKLSEQKTGAPEDLRRAMVETSTGMVMGTVTYMSPEQTRGLSVDARTDIWSLGAVLYEMLSGRAPFEGPTTSDVIVSVLEREPPSLTKLSPPVPEALEWIVTKALTKEREDRYQTAREILTDLRRVKERLDVAAKIRSEASPSERSESGESKPPEPQVWIGSLLGGSIIASHPRISPDGEMLAFRAIVDGESQVAIMKPDAASWTVLTHDRDHGSVASVGWAWDGSKIYFERKWGSGAVYAIAPLGGEPRLLLENAVAPEPLPDGSLIVLRPSSEGRQQLLRFWPDSGRLEPLPASVLWSDTRTVRAFPDGEEVAVWGFYGTRAGPRRLFALDLASYKARDLSAVEDLAGSSDFEELSHQSLAVSADGSTVFAQWKRDDSILLVALPRDGSKRGRTLLSLPIGAIPLAYDAAPDGSIYMDHSAFESSVLSIGAAGNVISETSVPMDAHGVLPLPGGGFVFTLTRGGRSHLLVAKAGAEPCSLLNTTEDASFPGAWLGSGKVAFMIGKGDKTRLAIGSVESGQVLQRFQFDAQNMTAVAASPDHHTVYYASDGALWAQPFPGGDPRKIGTGYDVAADPSGKNLYLMRAGANGYELLRMPASGGEAEKINLPADYSLTPVPLSPAAVNRDGRILLPVKTLGVFFFQAAIFDPARHSMAIVPVPAQTEVFNAGWAADGNVNVRITHWSSTLWRYRTSLASQANP
jgi:serine/threonine protein kinase/DNA-binding beta-propeller fold protein YncE